MRSFALAGPARLILTASAALALAGAGISLPAATNASAATAHPAAPVAAASKSAAVVKVARRPHFGKIVVTTHGLALYYLASGSCNSACIAVWPRLEMPRGKTRPTGTSCLGTAKVGRRLQVTYDKRRLYTFTGDSGTSVNGNNLSGFKVAKVVRCG